MTLTFRDATPVDAEPITALVESAYRGDSGRAGWTLEASVVEGRRTDAAAVAALIARQATGFVLAHQGPDLVGCCLLSRVNGMSSLGMLSVRPQLQRSGVGRALVAEAERRAVERFAAVDLHLQVLDEDHRLVGWYRSQGYRPYGGRVPFGPAQAGAVPQRPLHFATMVKRLPSGGTPPAGRAARAGKVPSPVAARRR